MKDIILTGIKPTGKLHFGNYFGAIKPALELAKNSNTEAMFFIAQQINKQSVKFSYGYNACDNINRMKIMLPINEKDRKSTRLNSSHTS